MPASSGSIASCCQRSRTKFGGGPVGLSTLAVSLGEEQDTIEDVYEPYLLQLGFLQRTPRGRVITELGRAHIGSEPHRGRTLLDDVDARLDTGRAGPLDEFVQPAHAHDRRVRERERARAGRGVHRARRRVSLHARDDERRAGVRVLLVRPASRGRRRAEEAHRPDRRGALDRDLCAGSRSVPSASFRPSNAPDL